MNMLEVTGLWKGFRVRGKRVEAVRGLDLYVEEGEIFGFLGSNGAGKTTTLRVLTTLLTPDRGAAMVAGFDLVRQPQRVRERIGYVGQSAGADLSASGRASLVLQARAYGMSLKAARVRAQEVIEQFDLAAFAERAARTYSGGQRRRLDLALGVIHRPALLFLDEPSAGLDPQSRAHLWEEVRKLHASGTTVFLTTHYLEEADKLCSRLAIIDNGQIVAEGTPDGLKQQIAGDSITLSLDDPEETLTRAQELLKVQAFVREVRQDGQKLQVSVEHGDEVLASVLHLLEEAGMQVPTIALTRPSLDDIFLRQTGRSLREEAATPATYAHSTR